MTETITTELVTRHQAILCPPTKREKNTCEIKYCPGGSQRCSTKWPHSSWCPGHDKCRARILWTEIMVCGMSSLKPWHSFPGCCHIFHSFVFVFPIGHKSYWWLSLPEYFDSMVKSDNSDLKWPLRDVKLRQDLRLSLPQIQMIWLCFHQPLWPLLIGWWIFFCFLIGKSHKSTFLLCWCLCLKTDSVNLVTIEISHMMKLNNPLFFPF